MRWTGLAWSTVSEWPALMIIAISTLANPPDWKNRLGAVTTSVPSVAEAYSIKVVPAAQDRPLTIVVTGKDPRGALFGVGKLLRNLDYKPVLFRSTLRFEAAEAPDWPLRGHQIGYRDTANSWDAWTIEQYDQYFRELAIFGTNAVENIPWQEDIPCPLMKYSREEMNLKFAELCDKYDLDHWIWVPVVFSLPNEAEEVAFLKQQEDFYRKVQRPG